MSDKDRTEERTFSFDWNKRHNQLGCHTCDRAIKEKLGVASCCPVKWSVREGDSPNAMCPIVKPDLDSMRQLAEKDKWIKELKAALGDINDVIYCVHCNQEFDVKGCSEQCRRDNYS